MNPACISCGRKGRAMLRQVRSRVYHRDYRTGELVRYPQPLRAGLRGLVSGGVCLDRADCRAYQEQLRQERRERAQRRSPPPPNDDAPRGTCRWCLQPITHEDGKPDRRRRWHHGAPAKPWEPRRCLREWQETQPGYQVPLLIERDGRRCAECGYDEDAEQAPMREWRKRQQDHLFRDGPDAGPAPDVPLPRRLDGDHRVPLADGGANNLGNMQLLCEDCHKAKTAREATERAARRRAAVSAQESLFATPS